MPVGKPSSFLLQVLGVPSIKDDAGQTPPALGWGKPLALLCLLAVRGDARRDEAVELLWRDVDEPKARNAFRQALHRLRSALGDDVIPQERERLRLVRSPRIVVDLDRFENAANAGRLDEALQLYTGDFLENTTLDEAPFDMWAEQERGRVRARFRQVLQDAVTEASASGRWMEAIARARRLLAIAPYEASAAQLAATTLVAAGRRIEAQELLQQFGSRLQAELGLAMPADVQTLLGRIARQQDRAPSISRPSARESGSELVLPLVGREEQLSQLLTMWRATRDDSGALALLEGDAGIGKSRLVGELAMHAKSLGRVLVLTGRERAGGAQLPLGIFAEALRPLVRAPGVVGASRHLLAEAARLLPELRDALDLPEVGDVQDEAARLRFFEGVAALIDAVAFEQPVLLVLEDLQLIAPSSLDLLSYLCVRLAGSAVTFLLTVRPAETPAVTLSRLRALARSSTVGTSAQGARAQLQVLSPLSSSEAAQAATPFARELGLSEADVQRIAQRSGGSPARLIELLRHAAAGEDIVALPVGMRELVAERLQRLSSAQRRLLLVISLIARPVPMKVAAGAAHLSDSAARESIDVLEQQALIERTADGSVAASALAGEIALDIAGEPSRAFLSGWIAEALSHTSDARPAELARFFAWAGQAGPAFENARRAAFDALALGASQEAVQFLQSARTFAATAEQQSEIESLLTTLGTGRRQLQAVAHDVAAADMSGAKSQTPERAPTSAPTERSWERLFPNWRILLGAAIATLVISAVVLGTRSREALRLRSGVPSTDTLVVSDGETARAVRYVTGDLATGFAISDRITVPRSDPPWLDSLTRPWTDAIADPRGVHVAVSKVTAEGSDIYVVSADRRDTVAIAVGQGDARPLGWSPDGRWLLARTSRTLPDGSFDADLFVYRIGKPDDARPIDSTARRAVTEAVWSPDGSRIAWVARVGAERQLEVFTSLADGSGIQNVSRDPADDHHISWSHDGELLAFTSARDGNAELYALSTRENRLWRLTSDPAQDDRGTFSRNGRLIAFESTRGGAAAVYVMPALGGKARRLDAASLAVRGWLGGGQRYIDRVRIDGSGALDPGDTIAVRLVALDQFDEPIAARDVQWQLLDSALAGFVPVPSQESRDFRALVGRRPGLARVVGSVGRWRLDTAFIRIGSQQIALLDGAGDPFRSWRPLGTPAPTSTGSSLSTSMALNADREWDSGILSRASLPLLPGLSFTATIDAPLSTARDAATSVSVALVAPEDASTIDAIAPQFLRYASFSWNADAGRFVYAVGREIFTEPSSSAAAALPIRIEIRVESDSTVIFVVAGKPRWRSSLRVIGAGHETRAHAWIGGRATGDQVRVSDVRVVLGEQKKR